MKKILFVAAAFVIGGSAIVVAQEQTQKSKTVTVAQTGKGLSRVGGQRDPQKIAEMKVSRLDKQVTLTEDQKKKALDIYAKTAAIRPSAEAGSKEKIVAARAEEKEAIDKILTPEQKQKMNAIMEERKARQEEAMKQRAAHGQPGIAAPPATENKLAK